MAVTIGAAELAATTGLAGTDPGGTVAARVLAVATRVVEDYAPNAPEVLQNEAVVRFAGYLGGSDFGGIVKDSIGPQATEYTLNHAAAFRNSGAAMLLTRYRVRRAGAI